MREISFRGRDFKGQWIKFNLFSLNMLRVGRIELNTIGQFTGFGDKKGVDIYEGDIVKIQYLDFDEYIIGYVFYDEKGAKFAISEPTDSLPYSFEDLPSDKFEVIGNIHDNPELLGVEE